VYTVAAGDAVALDLADAPPVDNGDAVALGFRPDYLAPFPLPGDGVALDLRGDYTRPDGGAVALAIAANRGDDGGEDDEPLETYRGTRSAWSAPWGRVQRRVAAATRVPYIDAPRNHAGTQADWARAQATNDATALPWGQNTPVHRATAATWLDSLYRRHTAVRLPWQSLDARRRAYTSPWQARVPAAYRGLSIAYNHPPARRRRWSAPSGDAPRRVRVRVVARYGHPPTQRADWLLPLGERGQVVDRDRPPPPPEPPAPDPDRPYERPDGDAVALEFTVAIAGDYPVDFHFGGEVAPPHQTRRSIVVSHKISLQRASDGQELPAGQIELSADLDSWAWDAQIGLLGDAAFQAARPTDAGPRTLVATIDGLEWRVSAEEVTRERSHEQYTYSASGRSRSAVLAAPHAPTSDRIESNDRTAIQIATDELPQGWSLDWQTLDWTVPGGVYSYRGQTPMGAITTIAAAVGAVVQSDRSAQTLHVIARYPTSPRAYTSDTPSVTLYADIVRTLGQQVDRRPGYNKVWVGGEDQGVLVGATREGTAGDYPMEPIVDALITERAAGQERGRVVLDGQGPGESVPVELPLIRPPDGPGLIEPGTEIEIEEPDGTTWTGLATSTTISVGEAGVSQSLNVERRWI
jgi:hypothetical protein